MLEINKTYNIGFLDGVIFLENKSVDLIVTDPPYKIVSGGCSNKAVTINACGGMLSKHSGDNIELVKKGKIFKHNDIKFEEWLPEAYRILKDGSHCYIMINGRSLAELQAKAEAVGFIYQNLLVWDKGNATPNKWYMNACEFILMLRKGKAKNINNMGSRTVLSINNIKKGGKVHPSQKPIELMKILIDNSTNINDLVVDPFSGSGSVRKACRLAKRNYLGWEIDKEFYDIDNDSFNGIQANGQASFILN